MDSAIKAKNMAVMKFLLWGIGLILLLVTLCIWRGMRPSVFAQYFTNGISLGSLYALIAIGYTMVYGILSLINFAHGDIFMMACYFGFYGIALFRMPWYLSFVFTVAATALLGILIEKIAYKPLRNAPKNSVLISAIAVSWLLENFATYSFSGKPKSFPEIPGAMTVYNIYGVSIQKITFIIPVVAIIFMSLLLYLVDKTKLGMAMRAVSRDHEISGVMGISVNRIISFTFVIGSALAGVGAFLWGIKYTSVMPLMGVMPGLKCFIAAVIGGIGNIKGALLGGFLLGMIEILVVGFFPELSGYKDAFAFIMLILILFIKPAGLLGKPTTEKV